MAPRRPLLALSRAAFAAFAACAAATGCNLLNGAGDLGVEGAASGGDATTGAVPVLDASDGGDTTDPRDAANAGDAIDATDARDARVADAGADTAPVDAAVSRYPAAVLADGPIAYFRLGETAGVAPKDETAHYAATYLTGTTVAVAGALAGDTDTAIRIGGSGGGVLITGTAFDFAGATPFSLEAWVKPAVVDTQYRFLFHHGGRDINGLRQDYGINMQSLQGLTFERFVDGTNQPAVFATPPSAGAWHHVVGVYDGAALVLYLDGANVAQSADARPLTATPGAFYIGAVVNPVFEKGLMADLDEVAIYDKALSLVRIQAHYAAAR